MQRTGRVDVFDLVCETTLNESEHRHENMITLALESLCDTIAKAKKDNAIEFWHNCFRRVMQCKADSTTLRHRIVRSICIPLLTRLPTRSVIRIFTVKCNNIVVISKLKSDLTTPLDPQDRVAYDTKISTFELLAALYQSIPATSINEKVSPIAMGMGTKGNALTKKLCQCSRNAVLASAVSRGTKYHHQYVCSAFNCLVSVVSETQNMIRFFNFFIFKETPLENKMIWENIAMPATFSYRFKVETNFRRIRWSLARQGSKAGDIEKESNNHAKDLRALSTQYLADSSFMTQTNDDNKDDMMSKQTLMSAAKKQEDEIYFELDELNSHPCTIVLLRALDRMQNLFYNNGDDDDDDDNRKIPSWRKSILSAFKRENASLNSKLLICKIIMNRPYMFKKYAQKWLMPCLDLAIRLENSGDHEGFHSFTREMCWIFVLHWSHCVPSTPEEIRAASNFMSILFKHAFHNTVSVRRSNIDIIGRLLTLWKSCAFPNLFMKSPRDLASAWKSSSSSTSWTSSYTTAMKIVTGTQLMAACVANEIPIHAGQGGGGGRPYQQGGLKSEWIREIVKHNLNFDGGKGTKAIYEATSEFVGILLRSEAHSSTRRNSQDSKLMRKIVTDTIKMMYNMRDIMRFLNCVSKIMMHYPAFVSELSLELPICSLMSSTMGEQLQTCAQILQDYTASLKELTLKSARSILAATKRSLNDFRRPASQLASLATIRNVLLVKFELVEDILNNSSEDVELSSIFSEHKDETCREAYFSFLIDIYELAKKKESEKEDSSSKTEMAYSLLLRGFGDTSNRIKIKLLSHWNYCLPDVSEKRVLELFSKMYDSRKEIGWLRGMFLCVCMCVFSSLILYISLLLTTFSLHVYDTHPLQFLTHTHSLTHTLTYTLTNTPQAQHNLF